MCNEGKNTNIGAYQTTLFRWPEQHQAERNPRYWRHRLRVPWTCKNDRVSSEDVLWFTIVVCGPVRRVYLLIQFSMAAYMTSCRDWYLTTIVVKISSTMMNDTIDALASLATFLSIHKGVVMKIVAIAMTKYRCANIESCDNENNRIMTFVAVSPTIML